jgi:hypothetical protein
VVDALWSMAHTTQVGRARPQTAELLSARCYNSAGHQRWPSAFDPVLT